MNVLSMVANLLIPKQPYRVGFWSEAPGQSCMGLVFPAELVDSSWDPGERARVAAYLQAGRVKDRYFGHSWCRLCGQTELGCADLTDGIYVWPEGFAHYVTEHAVRPPADFVAHVLSKP